MSNSMFLKVDEIVSKLGIVSREAADNIREKTLQRVRPAEISKNWET